MGILWLEEQYTARTLMELFVLHIFAETKNFQQKRLVFALCNACKAFFCFLEFYKCLLNQDPYNVEVQHWEYSVMLRGQNLGEDGQLIF